MANAAPKPAPAETPSLSGETNGFWNNPWKEAPAIDKAAPIIMATTIRGRRIWKMMVSCTGEVVADVRNNLDENAANTS